MAIPGADSSKSPNYAAHAAYAAFNHPLFWLLSMLLSMHAVYAACAA